MYPIVDVPEHGVELVEQLGTKFKFWYDDYRWLYKEGRAGTGEHWSEKACCEIARLLGLPHAEYEFARWRDRLGVVTRNFVPVGGRLVLGNEVLSKHIPDYPQAKRYQAREHRVGTVLALLRPLEISLPIGIQRTQLLRRASDVFVGYLMFDALVSNQDRHHENWGYVSTSAGVHLAPTFDHASSLGRNETDEARRERLDTRDSGRSVGHYVERARSTFFQADGSDRVITTLAAFDEAARHRPSAADYWLTRLGDCTNESFGSIFREIPRDLISPTATEFALKMVEINRRRLLGL